MNIYRLKNLVQELKQNPTENEHLIRFYETKEEELLIEINRLVKKRLEDLENQMGITLS